MATAKDFIARIDQIDGVDGCILIRDDGVLLAKTLNDSEVYSALAQRSAQISAKVMASLGFSDCSCMSFNRENRRNYHVLPIDNFLLGVVQSEDCTTAPMLERVHQLLDRVSTGGKESADQDML